MSDLVFPSPWLCSILVILPIGLFVGLFLRLIQPLPFREVWPHLFAFAAIPPIAIAPVGQIVECAILALACFACMIIAWHLGLFVQKSRP